MAQLTLLEMSPWRRRPLRIPPDSRDAWIQLAVWELWMGLLVTVILGLGVMLVVTSPGRIVAVSDLSACYAAPPVTLPCERIVYQGGLLNMLFTALFGLMLTGMGVWLLWELWGAVAPKPITDEFLKLLHESFARRWLKPSTWPWGRVLWAYGFTSVGVAATAGIAMTIWTLVAASQPPKTPVVQVNTSQEFRLGQ